MKVRLRTMMAGPEGCFDAGQVVDLDEQRANELLVRRYAERVADEVADDPTYLPWPDVGCTLGEARQRTADPELWVAANVAEKALLAGGGRGRRRAYISAPLNDDAEVSHKVSAERRRQELERAANLKWGALNSSFQNCLIEARQVAIGSKGSPTEAPTLIRSHAWSDMYVIDWIRSIAAERTKEKIRWYPHRLSDRLHFVQCCRFCAWRALRNRLGILEQKTAVNQRTAVRCFGDDLEANPLKPEGVRHHTYR